MRLILSAFAVLLVACSEQSPPTEVENNLTVTEQSVIAAADSAADLIAAETARLNSWLDEQFAEQLNFSPEFKTRLGDKSDYGLLDDYSEAGMDRQLAWLQASVASMQSDFDYERLTEDGKLSYDMWVYSLRRDEQAVPYRKHGYIFGRGGPHAAIPNFLINYHKVESAEDMQAYLSRLAEIDRVLAELLQWANSASQAGIRQPGFAYDFALAEIGRVTAGVPFNNNDSSPNSPLWTDIQDKIKTLVENKRIDARQAQNFTAEAQQILSTEVLQAYQEVRAWLEADKPEATELARGVWALPDGENYYNHQLALMTTVDLTADEIHSIGLSEVARIRGEMENIKDSVSFEGSLQDFFMFIREDPQFYFENTDEDRQAYLELNNEYLDGITAKLPDYFGRLPKAGLEIRRVEAFREQAGAAQHYAAGTPDGSRPGVFYSHMSDMGTLPIYQVEDVLYHEGIPGHHMQIAIQQELSEVPVFRTQYFTTSYVEGWGLYAEWLAKDMGAFADPYSDFGRLDGEMWRAIRLVVDTGIHANQWTEEQAVQYFLENSATPEAAIRSEIQRYFTSPGQATAYKIGMMKFQQLRAAAELALGDEFDIRAFHDVVLGAGALPLPLLEIRVERWISEMTNSIN